MKRDKKFIESHLYKKDGAIYTKENTKIKFQKRYLNKELAQISEVIKVFGVFSIHIEDRYSVSLIPAMMTTSPALIEEEMIGEEEYVVFTYGKNNKIIENEQVVKNKLLTYNLFQEFYMAGKMPWFMEYLDNVKLFDNMVKYADGSIGGYHLGNELIIAFVTKQKDNITEFHRMAPNKPYIFTAIDEVFYSVNSTLNKIAGNYFSDGLISALVNKEKSPTHLEDIVRN